MPDTDLLEYDDAAPERDEGSEPGVFEDEDEPGAEGPRVGADGTLSVSRDELDERLTRFEDRLDDALARPTPPYEGDEDDYEYDEDENPLAARLREIADIAYEDPVRAEWMRMELVRDQMHAEQQAQIAQQVHAARPALEEAILQHTADGVSPHVRAELERELRQADPFVLAQIVQNPTALREVALRVKGRQFEVERGQAGARAPATGRPSGRFAGTLSADAEADVQDLMRQGFTREGAVRILRETK